MQQNAYSLWNGYGAPRLWWLRLFAVSCTGLSQFLLSAPFSWWPLHWVAWVPFFWAILSQEGRGRLFLGFWGGTLSNLCIFYWVLGALQDFGHVHWSLAIPLLGLMCAALSLLWIGLALGTFRLHERYPKHWHWLVPALLVSLEFLMPQMFPYMQGVTHYQVPALFQIVSLFGVYAMSFLILWGNALLFRNIQHGQARQPLPLRDNLIFGVVLWAVFLYGQTRKHVFDHKARNAKTLKVGLIQSNFQPQEHQKLGHRAVLDTYVRLSRQAVSKGADWVIWSEGELKIMLGSPLGDQVLRTTVRRIGKTLLTGTYGLREVRDPQNPRVSTFAMQNSAIHITPDGTKGQRYDKIILVPFGEYIPFERQLGWLYRKITPWRSRFLAGKQPWVQTLDGMPYGFLICYEAIFPSYVGRFRRRGARLLVNLTYDAWFGKTTASYQHLMLAAIRSAELGIPLIRLATTGVSTTVDALGRMQTLSSLYKQQVLVHKIRRVQLFSLYAQIGDLFAWLCVLLIAACFIVTPYPKNLLHS